MRLRRILPWMASLLVHAILAVVSQDTRISQRALPASRRMIEVVLEQAGPIAGGPGNRPAVLRPRARAAGRAPLIRSSARPTAPKPGTPQAARPEREELPPDEPFPEASSSRTAPAEAVIGEPGGAGTGPRFGWEGEPRRIIRSPGVKFPRVLSASGQEVDCEARITVDPSGVVSHVEITRSSGYTEIDASVEAALRGYLFSRDYGFEAKTAVGTVRFRFRLERYD